MARKRPDIITDLFASSEQRDANIQAQELKNRAAIFYLDPDWLTRPEAAWLNLRRDTGSPVCRSGIVEAALLAALEGSDRYGLRSRFARML